MSPIFECKMSYTKQSLIGCSTKLNHFSVEIFTIQTLLRINGICMQTLIYCRIKYFCNRESQFAIIINQNYTLLCKSPTQSDSIVFFFFLLLTFHSTKMSDFLLNYKSPYKIINYN